MTSIDSVGDLWRIERRTRRLACRIFAERNNGDLPVDVVPLSSTAVLLIILHRRPRDYIDEARPMTSSPTIRSTTVCSRALCLPPPIPPKG